MTVFLNHFNILLFKYQIPTIQIWLANWKAENNPLVTSVKLKKSYFLCKQRGLSLGIQHYHTTQQTTQTINIFELQTTIRQFLLNCKSILNWLAGKFIITRGNIHSSRDGVNPELDVHALFPTFMIKGDKILNINISNRNLFCWKSLWRHLTWTMLGFLVIHEISKIMQGSIQVTFINHAKTYYIIVNNQLQSAPQIIVWAVPYPTLM